METARGGGERRALATLGIEKGPGAGSDLAVGTPTATIGKSTQNDVVIDDDSVSTRHARLDLEAAGWTITDLASANGTYLDGTRLAPDVPTPLAAGATLRFGAVQTKFSPASDVDHAAARESYAAPPPRTRVADRRSGFRFPLWLLLVVILLIAAIWFGLVWQPEPEPTPASEQPAIGMVRLAPHLVPPA